MSFCPPEGLRPGPPDTDEVGGSGFMPRSRGAVQTDTVRPLPDPLRPHVILSDYLTPRGLHGLIRGGLAVVLWSVPRLPQAKEKPDLRWVPPTHRSLRLPSLAPRAASCRRSSQNIFIYVLICIELNLFHFNCSVICTTQMYHPFLSTRLCGALSTHRRPPSVTRTFHLLKQNSINTTHRALPQPRRPLSTFCLCECEHSRVLIRGKSCRISVLACVAQRRVREVRLRCSSVRMPFLFKAQNFRRTDAPLGSLFFFKTQGYGTTAPKA